MPPLILLIDNDPLFVYLIGRYAEQSGYALGVASSVHAARSMLEPVQPTIVLFNLLLAAADDGAGLAELQADLACRDIPIIGCSDTTVAAGDLAFEVDYYLAQPLLYADFCDACASLGVDRKANDSSAIE